MAHVSLSPLCRLIGVSKLPFQLVQVPLPWQHAVSRNECKLLSAAQKSLLVQRPVRVMLSTSPDCGPDSSGCLHLTQANIWFVAKDVAQLLHIHEANVARRIAPFLLHERARMPVLCLFVLTAHTQQFARLESPAMCVLQALTVVFVCIACAC